MQKYERFYQMTTGRTNFKYELIVRLFVTVAGCFWEKKMVSSSLQGCLLKYYTIVVIPRWNSVGSGSGCYLTNINSMYLEKCH